MAETWNLPGTSGVCAASGKPFEPGQEFWTGVTIEEGMFVRREYTHDAWNDQLQKQAFSFWRSHMPHPDTPEPERLVDEDVLLEFFRKLEDQDDENKRNFRYVLGLLLVRKKLFKLVDMDTEDGVEVLILKEIGGDTEHRVTASPLDENALRAVQIQVKQILNIEESTSGEETRTVERPSE